MMRKHLAMIFVFILILGGLALAFAQEASVADLLKTGDEMLQTAAKLRGLEPKGPIQKGVKDKAEISRFLNDRVQEEYAPNEIAKEGKILKKLGLIPPTMDYRAFVIKLLTEQVGGYYDPEKKTFFIASWLPAEEQKPVMIHELTHALQDQYFDVAKIMKDDRSLQNDDRTLAHQAVMEGDGMVTMLQYLLEPIKRHFSQVPDLASVMQASMVSAQLQLPVFKEAPAYLKETLIFPYGYGASFLQYVWRKNPSWESVNKIYSDMPASTEQIMHPEKYYGERDMPKPVSAEEFAAKLGPGWKITDKNVLGEFSLGLLLSLHLTEEWSKRAASGWGGDQVLLLENDQGKDAVLLATVWDSQEMAERFSAAMDEWFRQGFPKAQRLNASPAGFALIQDGEFYSIHRDGAAIRLIFGLPEADGRKLKDF
ncbi:MAG TPA: hypothetical protein VMG30_18055 [Acidobacteriota bacterium]|nr:hypothetical protein [Acidobacteriota bacterium]